MYFSFFSFLTLQPNSTVSFITISLYLCFPGRKKKQSLSILINIIISIKKLKKSLHTVKNKNSTFAYNSRTSSNGLKFLFMA